MPFEAIRPLVHNVTVPSTAMTAELRTTTARSFSGTEIPWINYGFEPITLNETNYLTTPRTIAAKVNAAAQLSALPGDKSLQLRCFLSTADSRVSPIIDAQRCSVITVSNRINRVVGNYATDSRVKTIDLDPTACQYISKEMILENNSTSLKVLLSAHLDVDADIRVLYAINNKEGMDPIFTPFPGYKNLNYKGEVISQADNDGLSDKLITKSNSSGFDNESLEF